MTISSPSMSMDSCTCWVWDLKPMTIIKWQIIISVGYINCYIKYFTKARSRMLLTDAAGVTGYQHREVWPKRKFSFRMFAWKTHYCHCKRMIMCLGNWCCDYMVWQKSSPTMFTRPKTHYFSLRFPRCCSKVKMMFLASWWVPGITISSFIRVII